jgi:immune inhibitor A
MAKRTLVLWFCLLLVGCTSSAAAPPSPIAVPPTLAPTLTPSAVSPAPTLTLAPTPTLQPTPSPIPTPADPIAALDLVRRPPVDALELAFALGPCRPDPPACTIDGEPIAAAQVGDVRSFWISDGLTYQPFQVEAELIYVGPIVQAYLERNRLHRREALIAATRLFEDEIYPRTRAIFGSEAPPLVPGAAPITILNAYDPAGRVLGYFSARDLLPSQANRFSNERQMFVMNVDRLDPATPAYFDVLAHEFQHMIHQHQAPGSATWFNEGNSQLAQDLNGYVNNNFTSIYLYDPDVQLTGWSSDPGRAGAHYGAAHLFLRYIYAHYAGVDQLLPLMHADAGNTLAAFVALAQRTRPDYRTFGELVADWAVANLIDDPAVGDGRYTYATGHELPELLPGGPTVAPVSRAFAGSVAQFGVDYLALPAGTTRLSFSGATAVGVAAEPPRDAYAWWSGRGDGSFATLTLPLDLRTLARATLHFDTWYELEREFDYAFITVSLDGGRTWETLPGNATTTDDPQGQNFGHGFTGISGAPGVSLNDGVRGRWVAEQADLSSYAGQELLLRFWQVSDLAVNGPGWLIDNIRIPELGFSDDVEAGPGAWQAEGFSRIGAALPQRWELRFVRTAADGARSVEPLAVGADGRTIVQLAPGERAVLVVVAATPHTSERAGYTLTLE